jgi:hypothetical protein
VSLRLLYLIFLRLLNLLLLLARSSASKDIEPWCCATKSPCYAEPTRNPAWTGQIERCSPRKNSPARFTHPCRRPVVGPRETARNSEEVSAVRRVDVEESVVPQRRILPLNLGSAGHQVNPAEIERYRPDACWQLSIEFLGRIELWSIVDAK